MTICRSAAVADVCRITGGWATSCAVERSDSFVTLLAACSLARSLGSQHVIIAAARYFHLGDVTCDVMLSDF